MFYITLFGLFVDMLFIVVNSFTLKARDYIHETPMIAGIDVVGCGFDITTLKSKQCLIDINQISDLSTWTDPSNISSIFRVPHGFFVFPQSELLDTERTNIVKDVHQYFSQSIYTVTQDKSGFLGFGSSHRTKEIGYIYERIYKNTNSLLLTLRQIIWYNLMVATFPPPTLSSMAKRVLDELPKTFDASDANNILKFRQFFDSFGTHIVTESDMGGLVWAQDWFQSCMLIVRNESWIKQQVRKKYDPIGIFRSSSVSYHTTVILDETFQNTTTSEALLLGGTESIPMQQWKEWVPTIKYQPRPVSYRLQPIYMLLPQDSQQREILMNATLHFRSEVETEATEYIQRLQSVPDPPPSTCPTSKRKRSTMFEITPEARAALCPYSSYTGITCPGTTPSFFLSGRQDTGGSSRMLRSVGMGLDIANGDIRFMALNLTYDESKLSIVPSTRRSLVTFNEVIFQQSNPVDDTQVFTRTFSNAEEIVKQWDDVLNSGEIDGGEFSRLLNTQEYRDLFNSNPNSIIDIIQQPYPVYRLKIDRSKSQLNFFSRNALAQLTAEYNYDLYSQFFYTFGTHIVLRTVMGDMTEQKIKKQTTGGGLECEWIVSIPPPEVLSSKRLGGLVDAGDEQSWKASIDTYPAVLKIMDFASWSEFTNDPIIKGNLERGTKEYVQKIRSNL
ncbi:hypothetical protein I4U23_023289 [Adineta vaga]|nr:hypothetical protein I4U23_023289 [Adineta vaga]